MYIFDAHRAQGQLAYQIRNVLVAFLRFTLFRDSDTKDMKITHHPMSQGIVGKVASTGILVNTSQLNGHRDFDAQVDDMVKQKHTRV